MEQTISLNDWLDNHNITYTIRHDLLIVPGFGRCLIQDKYEHIFKQDKKSGEVVFNSMENPAFLLGDDIYYIVFPFGNRWFYVDIREEPSAQQFHILRWIGNTPKQNVKAEFYPLGIHSGYELLNGSGLLKDWCSKTKWLGYKGLGVADMNTMASTLDLQTSATSQELKYVFGYSTQVDFGSERIGVKIYSQTQQGFKNLLKIQKSVCVDNVNDKHIEYYELLNRAQGNVLVFDKLSGEWLAKQLSDDDTYLQSFIDAFEGWVYFQIDTTEYKADRIDSQVLLSLKAYFDAFYKGNLEYAYDVCPVLIQDVYYLDKEDWKTKIVLNKVDIGAAHEQSNMQYLKTLDELYGEFRSIFSDKYTDDVFYDMCIATADIIEGADAAYDLTENYAPKYDMTAAEKEKYGTTLNMFNHLIEEGFKKLVPEGQEELYRERIEYEKYIITSTDNVDYILITWDELNWAQRNGILTGIGRGSAGGSLLLYVMGITNIDPIKYGLIFERFLLPERGGLESCQVTKMAKQIQSDNYIEMVLENGKTYKFDIDAKFHIKRGNEELDVYADELQIDDDIVWDNNNLLWSL
jgi:DNA polymerase III subunit alpha